MDADHPMMKKSPLRSIVFEVTEHCNYNCLHCYNIWNNPGHGEYRGEKKRSTHKKIMRVLKRLFKHSELQQVTFTGGEPLLAERLEEVILYTGLKGKRINLISNGSGDPERYQRLASLGVGLMEIPLHSTVPSIHDEMTASAGSHRSSLKALEGLRECNAEVIPVMVLTSINKAGIKSTMELYRELGYRYAMVNLFNPGGTGLRYLDKLVIPDEELPGTWQAVNDAASSRGITIHSGVCIPPCVLDHRQYPAVTFVNCRRELAAMPITVDLEGSLRVCNHSSTVISNIFEQKPEEWLADERLPEWFKNLSPECEACGHSPVSGGNNSCIGRCGAADEQRTLAEH
jgi:MoaA/NifB/PqqE/SkfB family radical SAM enzyme